MNEKIKIAITAAILTALINTPSAAMMYRYCSQPMTPSTYISKPMKPFCASSGRCDKWQVDSYNNEVERYYGKLKQYAQEVDSYYEDAYSYIKCMAELD